MQRPDTILETGLQRQTLRLYGELLARRGVWAGKLVFSCGEGSSASGLGAATSIAGGTSLAVDPDADTVKSVFRQGGVDFVVNTLDEALRVLKNEVRQGRPLGVALIAEAGPVLDEMIERGVLPDLQVEIGVSEQVAQMEELERAGMERLRLLSDPGSAALPSVELSEWLSRHGWLETLVAVPSGASGERATDASLLEMLPPSDVVRRNWIQRISRYQRRSSGSRLVWLTGEEQRLLVPDSVPEPS